MNEESGREFGWDDVIQNDGQEFEPIPEGDYDFVIDKFERSRCRYWTCSRWHTTQSLGTTGMNTKAVSKKKQISKNADALQKAILTSTH